GADGSLVRIRRRPLRAFFRYGHDCRLYRNSRDHGAGGAQKPAGHDYWTLRRHLMPRIRKPIPGVDPKLLIKDAAKLLPDPTRRLFLRGGASLGALTFLTGCDLIDGPSAERVLMKISHFNDEVQAWLFNPNRLAPTYPESAIPKPFPSNGYYPQDDSPER